MERPAIQTRAPGCPATFVRGSPVVALVGRTRDGSPISGVLWPLALDTRLSWVPCSASVRDG